MIGIVTMLVLAAAPPSADDVRCLTDQFTPAERSEIARAGLGNTDPDQVLRNRLEQVVVACAGSRAWTPDQAGQATGVAMAVVIRDEIGAELRSGGMDPAAADAWLARQSEQIRTTPELAQADAERLVHDLHAAGVPLDVLERNGRLIGGYLGAQIMIERAERGLPLQ